MRCISVQQVPVLVEDILHEISINLYVFYLPVSFPVFSISYLMLFMWYYIQFQICCMHTDVLDSFLL
jgi:hypothetical protein